MKKEKMWALGIGAAMMASSALSHMRNVAFSPFKFNDRKASSAAQQSLIDAAKEKRLRKQKRNLAENTTYYQNAKRFFD